MSSTASGTPPLHGSVVTASPESQLSHSASVSMGDTSVTFAPGVPASMAARQSEIESACTAAMA